MTKPTNLEEAAEQGVLVSGIAPAETALAVQEPFDNGLGELEAGDLIIPRLSITQKTTPDIENENIGKLCINVTGDYADSMDVALIKLNKSRILFPETYNKDNDPLCRSHNFKVPADDIKDAPPMAALCADCNYSKWAGSTPPRCQETWNLLIVDTETYMPMWFSAKSLALKPLRKIISALSMLTNAKRIPMWGFNFKIALEKDVRAAGDSYVPTFSKLNPLNPEDSANMGDIQKQLANVDIKDSDETETADAPFSEPEQEEAF